MYRIKIKELIQWKISKNRKPLIVQGARQVGKTWLIKEFGKTEFAQTVHINFEKMNRLQDLFKQDLDPHRIIGTLEAFFKTKINAANTLIVFDEIQSASKGLTSLKYFCEDAPEYFVIASDSLLGMNLHRKESFPVGKVNFLYLFPMNFHEFLLALGETGMAEILEKKHFDMLPVFVDKFKEYLRYYFYIGGMPEVVNDFVEKRDWRNIQTIQNEILATYENDFSKHAPRELVPRLNMVWQNIPAQLSKENKKFIYGVMKEGARAKDFEMAIQWLVDSGILLKSYRVSEPRMPLIAYQDMSAFKLFFNDVGLLAAKSKLDLQTIIFGNDVFIEYKGAFAEQFVMQQLRAAELDYIGYWTNERGAAEMDFVVQNEGEIIPIEVKAETNLKAKRFKLFCEKFKPKTAYKSSLTDYKEENWMTNLPLYAINTITRN
ncbi:MAG: ATP-binding protein [Dysgonamonadaceae bacterium]|jgi:predicted AAA+ superfamily ATPase|nr:ATP-binding protein [Dysgonamonadaceae bacterium]